MKYMLIMQSTLGSRKKEGIETWPPEAGQAHIECFIRLNKELAASGELVGVQALAPYDEALEVRARKDGTAAITDGPFPESKEFLAGFWVVDVASPQRACEIAARASAAPGPEGVPLNMPIQVRQVISAPSGEK
jgi:hypothetical protein